MATRGASHTSKRSRHPSKAARESPTGTSGRSAGAAPDSATRLRLIEAAGPVFARRGFADATVREIVAAGGANIAAVNYHFGDKIGLYRAVLEHYSAAAVAAHPLPPLPSGSGDAPAMLRAFVAAFLERLFHEGKPAWMSQIIAREMVEPTPAFRQIAETHMGPQIRTLRGVVSALMDLPVTDPRVQRCAASVIAQCVTYKQCRAAHEHLTPGQTFDAAGRASLAEHIASFSLAGIRGVSKEAGR